MVDDLHIEFGDVIDTNKMVPAKINLLEHPLEALRAKLAGQQIEIVEVDDDGGNDDDDLVQIISGESVPLRISPDPLVALAVSAEGNLAAAQSFFQSLRGIAPEILGGVDRQVPYEFSGTDLVALANRWKLPLAAMESGGHWFLMLRMPEQVDGRWGLPLYNPFDNGVEWRDLDGWDAAQPWGAENMARFGNFFFSELAFDERDAGVYDLSLWKESRQDLIAAKSVGLQRRIDGWNCGPAVLMSAALRQGAKEGDNAFKTDGRGTLRSDTGLEVKTREEILGWGR